MYKASDFRIITYKNDDELRRLGYKLPNSVSYPYAFPYAYVFTNKPDKYIVKVGRSRQPYYRLSEFNQHTRKYLNGVEFKASIIIDSPVYFENYLKKLLSGARFEVDSRIDGSTEV